VFQLAQPLPVYRLSVEQYHAMIRHGILKDDDPVELLEGILVQQMGKNPPHTFATQVLRDQLPPMMPAGHWFVSDQEPVTVTDDSEPEPDVFVVRGSRRDYLAQDRHPAPDDMGLVIEVSDTTLATDRGTKRRVYASANVAEYWIVNLVDRRVEVYTDPSGPCDDPVYRQQRDHNPGDEVPVVLDGAEVGRIRVDDLLS
jgi:Uma2 family endonuclease